MKLKTIDGKPVFNAKHPLKIHVTKADVAKADVKEPATCAVARACARDLHTIEARVHLSRVYLRSNKGNWVRYETPKAMRSEIIAFDRGGTFEPGEFVLGVPEERTMGKRQGGKPRYKHARDNPKRKPRVKHVTANVRGGPA